MSLPETDLFMFESPFIMFRPKLRKPQQNFEVHFGHNSTKNWVLKSVAMILKEPLLGLITWAKIDLHLLQPKSPLGTHYNEICCGETLCHGETYVPVANLIYILRS